MSLNQTLVASVAAASSSAAAAAAAASAAPFATQLPPLPGFAHAGALPSSLLSLLGGLGGFGGWGGAGPLGWLAGFLPLLLGFSSAIRGFLGQPLKWVLDLLFTTCYVDIASPPYTWLSLYLSDLPGSDRLLVNREIEVEVVPEALEDEDVTVGRLDYYGEPMNPLHGSSAAKLHNFRLIPLPSSHTFLRHENHLLIVSRESRTSHSLTKTRYGGGQRSARRNARYGGNESSSAPQDETIKYLKIRFIPLPRFPTLSLPFFSTTKSPSSPAKTSQQVLDDLVRSAKEHFAERDQRGVTVYRYEYDDETGMRTWIGKTSRGKRSISSVVLPDGIGEDILEDVKEFLGRRDWYSERGIPHRRGILLYGEPGAGKTSLCTAVASSLLLNIYVLDLADEEVGDAALLQALNQTPPNCIVLMEDIDCAFAPRPSSLNVSSGFDPSTGRMSMGMPMGQSLTLSGLLNAIDGVGASEGRICFATTNHIARLDPALIRPGRMDRQVAFSLATKAQASGLFKQMMLPTKSEVEAGQESSEKEEDEKTTAKMEGFREEVWRLAEVFSARMPENTFSTASIQGYLLRHKENPQSAVDGVSDWVLSERLVNEEQRRNADEEWELRLRLKAKDERRKERLMEKIKKKALRAEDSTDADDEDDKDKKERKAREGRKEEDEEGSPAPGLPTPDSSSVAPSPVTSSPFSLPRRTAPRSLATV